MEFSPGEPVEIIYKTGPNKERVKKLTFVPRPITSRHTRARGRFGLAQRLPRDMSLIRSRQLFVG